MPQMAVPEADGRSLYADVTFPGIGAGDLGGAAFSAAETVMLRRVNQKIAGRTSLADVVDFLFEQTRELLPCDRLSFALVDDDRVTSHYTRADYEPLLLASGYSGELEGSSLHTIMATGEPRLIPDLGEYLRRHPQSRASRLLVKEGVASSLTLPLRVDGRVVGFLFRSSRETGVYDDHHALLSLAITERLSQTVEKTLLVERLKEANDAYFGMLGFVSHELKSPVASLVTDARMLSQGYLGELDDRQRDKVERIAAKGEYLLDIIREYLDLAQVESGELVPELRTDVDFVAEVVAPAVEITETLAAANEEMRLVVDAPDTLAPATCDPALLRIVLANLLSNAVKYGTPGGAVRLTVLGEPERLLVKVWNQGPGFPADQRGRLFRRFSRLDTPELKKRRGTGLGLFSARRIVMLHHGHMGADSQEGAWAEFWFSIPQSPADVPATAAPASGGAS